MIETLLGIDTWEFNRFVLFMVICVSGCIILNKLFSKTTES